MVRRLRILVLQALRRRTSSCSTVGARSGSSTAQMLDALPQPPADVVHRQGAGRVASAPSVTRPCRPSARRTWSTSAARRVRRPAAGPGPLPRSRPSARAHPDRGQRPVEQGRERRRHLQVRRRAQEIYTEAGVDSSKDTIAYCRIGERTSHTWFVLKEGLAQPNVKNYDGSWTEYGSLVGVPVASATSPAKQTGRAPDVRCDRRAARRSTASTLASRQ